MLSTTQIREASRADIPRIVEMGMRSLAEGPYSGRIGKNPQRAAELAIGVIEQKNGRLLVSDENGILTGLLGFLTYPHYFTGELTAIEIMWWVEPEYRKSMTAICLFRAAERMARTMGAKRMQFTAPTPEVELAYQAMGYKRLEVGYEKELDNASN